MVILKRYCGRTTARQKFSWKCCTSASVSVVPVRLCTARKSSFPLSTSFALRQGTIQYFYPEADVLPCSRAQNGGKSRSGCATGDNDQSGDTKMPEL